VAAAESGAGHRLALRSLAIIGDFDGRVLRFQTHWDRFLRAFWGCAATDTSRNDCRAQLSTIDRREYEAARKAAAELFQLR
jgi:hypothetical protein